MSNSGQILVIEDDEVLQDALAETLSLSGYSTTAVSSAEEGLGKLQNDSFNLVLCDIQMPAMSGEEFLLESRRRWPEVPVVLMTAFGDVERAVKAIRSGAADYITKPFEAEVLLATASRYIQIAEDEEQAIFEDQRSRSVAELAVRVAETDASIVISGESGVGKEVFARLIHQNSARCAGPFVAINCAAIPESMLESILFGYERGAFTGAYTTRPGKLEHANGGTLLLDEISEMDISLQAKLLRVIQEREVERLGGKHPISLDIRILATTNRDLAAEVRNGNFREDLYYRLNVFPLRVPPLRERPGDIIPMCHRFIQEMAPGQGIVLDDFARQLLIGYHWPGNVRELHNVIQRALILKRGLTVDEQSIFFANTELTVPAMNPTEAAPVEEPVLAEDLKSREMELIIQTLSAERGSRKHTAEKLGISPRTLRYKLAKFREQGINIPGMSPAVSA